MKLPSKHAQAPATGDRTHLDALEARLMGCTAAGPTQHITLPAGPAGFETRPTPIVTQQAAAVPGPLGERTPHRPGRGRVDARKVAEDAARRLAQREAATQFQQPALTWSPPEPLPKGLPPVAPFDLALLPATLRPWISDIAERMQCPPDFPAVGAMVALGTVVGRQCGIRPKQQDDWTVIANLWGGVIGRPSLLKTPALQEPLKRVEALEARARDAHQAAEREHAAELLLAEAGVKGAKGRIAKALKDGDTTLARALALEAGETPAAPVRRRYLTQDATVEKIGELLRDNPRGLLVYRDELVGFLRTLEKEGREGSRAFYLEAWNGTGSFTYDRIGRGTVEMPAACVSIIGAIQPGPLADYLRDAIAGGAGDDGLMQRFQLAVWPDAPHTWRNVDRWPDTDARRTARGVFERLDQIDPPSIGAQQDEGDTVPWMRFAPDAQEEFDAWRAALEARLRSGELHPALEAHLAKYRSLAPSLALLIHLADAPACGPVPAPALLRALAWCEYLETHARRIYAPALAPDLDSAAELARRLPTLPHPFTARDVYRNCWRLLDPDGTRRAIEVLLDHGHIRLQEDPTPPGRGRPSPRYRIHPSLRSDP